MKNWNSVKIKKIFTDSIGIAFVDGCDGDAAGESSGGGGGGGGGQVHVHVEGVDHLGPRGGGGGRLASHLHGRRHEHRPHLDWSTGGGRGEG